MALKHHSYLYYRIECGTKSVTEGEASKYDYYTPNYNNALAEKMREKILDDECDYFNSEDFGF